LNHHASWLGNAELLWNILEEMLATASSKGSSKLTIMALCWDYICVMGLDALEDLLEKLRKQRKDLILCGPHSRPLFALARGGFLEKIGEENVCGDMEASLARARQILLLKKPG
jgi:sulfate permease, SulP family